MKRPVRNIMAFSLLALTLAAACNWREAGSGSGLTLVSAANAQATAPSGSADASDPFLRISGSSILHRGTPVRLRGVNHNNITALCSRVPGNVFGSCKIDDINIAEGDYRAMVEMGINHVRFGMAYRWFRDDPQKFFAVLDKHVAWARKHGVWLIWNLFTTPTDCYEGYTHHCSLWENKDEQDQLKAFWVEMARHYRDEPVVGGYGLLNEPTPPAPEWSKAWDRLAETLRKSIADVNPDALVFIGTTSSGQFNQLYGGKNVVYEVHDYLPVSYTHAHNNALMYPGTAPDWDGEKILWDKKTLVGGGSPRADLNQRLALGWARKQNVPVYIGEWGTNNQSRGYIQFVRDRAEIYNNVFDVHHAFFLWRGNAWQFALFPPQGDLVPHNKEFLEAARTGWVGATRPRF